jgi:hypothetical protein
VLGVEDVFDLSELRNGFESRGIRIVPLAHASATLPTRSSTSPKSRMPTW